MHRDALSPGQRVVRGQHDDDLLVQEIDEFESMSIRVQRPAQECNVERSGAQAGHRLNGVLAMENEPQVGQMRGHERTQGWKDPNIGGRKCSDR